MLTRFTPLRRLSDSEFRSAWAADPAIEAWFRAVLSAITPPLSMLRFHAGACLGIRDVCLWGYRSRMSCYSQYSS